MGDGGKPGGSSCDRRAQAAPWRSIPFAGFPGRETVKEQGIPAPETGAPQLAEAGSRGRKSVELQRS